MTWFCKEPDGICRKRTGLNGGGGGSAGNGGPVAISASVGLNGVNAYNDVVTIQDALNRIPIREGGASPRLVTDGICGPKTQNAIQSFQVYHFGWKGADALVEPFKQTIARINEILGPQPMLPDLAPSIQNAMSWVLRARYTIDLAGTVLESEDSSLRRARMRLLNKHFALDSVTSRRQTYEMIRVNYARMSQVFQRPGGPWGPAVFQRDPYGKPWVAYTFGPGYFRAGEWEEYEGRRVARDSIYLCRVFDGLDLVGRSYTIIHELSHFVGSPGFVDDYAYNRQGAGTAVMNLPPNQKSLNAENYSNFALEVSTGREMLII